MKPAPIRILLAIVLSLWLTTSAWAGSDEGPAVEIDYAIVLEETRQRAVAGDATAQTSLGDQYVVGAVVPRNYAEAAKW